MNFRQIPCAVALSALCACGPVPTVPTVSDAGADAGSTDGGAVAGRQSLRRAIVHLSQSFFGDAGSPDAFATSSVIAGFVELPGCQEETFGACRFTSCPQPGSAQNAGRITIEGSSVDGGVSLDLSAGARGLVNRSALWTSPRQVLTVRGSGGTDVPAFAAILFPPGRNITFTTTPCSATTCAPHSMATPLQFEWQGMEAGTWVRVQLSAPTADLECEASSLAGRLEVPPAALARLGSGAVNLWWYPTSRVVMDAGGWPIDVAASENPTPPVSMTLR
jgi:hypothetical protein